MADHPLLSKPGRLFGTDGVRGVANLELDPQFALDMGRAAGLTLREGPVLIGRDTRRSGEMLSSAIQAGFHSAGIDTIDVGVLPSGGISHLTAETSAEMGVVISASHNPAPDNGIKLLSKFGTKLTDAQEDKIEERMRKPHSRRVPYGASVGTRFIKTDALDGYVGALAKGADYSFQGTEIVLDCANGAAFQSGPMLFERLKASVEVLGANPDGMNINDGCGATHPEFLAARVNGRVGFAFDGDADRLIAVDEAGGIVDGDRIMAIVALHWKRADRLKNNLVVSTVMSNLGFKRAMREAGIDLIETKVGDRYVVEAMRANKAILGGEQSGHIIFADRGRTGDGLLTAVRVLEVMAGTGKPLAELAAEAMVAYPQVLTNVAVENKGGLDDAKSLWDHVRRVEEELQGDGRVLIRPSGTEPLVRVMVEAPSQERADFYAGELASTVARVLA
ncbi:MAG: phosphoglucosamine mutase [Acidimicrobiia bacterium]|nr:phosphoglucosamine mutase [Acidimicrobiia bacterium]